MIDALPSPELQGEMNVWLRGALQEAAAGYWKFERYLLTPSSSEFRRFNEEKDVFLQGKSDLEARTKQNPYLNPPQLHELELKNLLVLVKREAGKTEEELYFKRDGLPDPFLEGEERGDAKKWESLLPHFGSGAEARVYYAFPKGTIDEKQGEVTPLFCLSGS